MLAFVEYTRDTDGEHIRTCMHQSLLAYACSFSCASRLQQPLMYIIMYELDRGWDEDEPFRYLSFP